MPTAGRGSSNAHDRKRTRRLNDKARIDHMAELGGWLQEARERIAVLEAELEAMTAERDLFRARWEQSN